MSPKKLLHLAGETIHQTLFSRVFIFVSHRAGLRIASLAALDHRVIVQSKPDVEAALEGFVGLGGQKPSHRAPILIAEDVWTFPGRTCP
jgi:hypothetical protein